MEKISYGREFDRKVRVCVLETMGAALRTYGRTKDNQWLEEGKALGAEARRLAEKMEKFDYSEVDKEHEFVEDLHEKWEELLAEDRKNI